MLQTIARKHQTVHVADGHGYIKRFSQQHRFKRLRAAN